jgi:glycosyltransferase involved in cell wall biosynthesis
VRILLLNQYYAPDEAATAQLLSDLGAALVKKGHEVYAVASRRAYADPERRYPLRGEETGVRVRRVRGTAFGRRRRLGRVVDYASFLLGAALRCLRVPRPDVVVSLSTPPLVASLGWAVAKLRGARTLFWVMDVYPDLAIELGALSKGSVLARTLARAGRGLLRRSDCVVALDRTMADRLVSQGARTAHVIANWADGDSIRPVPIDGHPLRIKNDWDGRLVVLYSGNMGLAHEFETLLDAAERLMSDSRVRFAFVGDGPRRAEIVEGARARGLENVEFHPYAPRDRLGESLTAGDLHVVTLRPGMPGLLVPSKIYGILAAGRPTLYVGPPAGEVHEIVSAGCGVSVRNGSAGELVDAIVRYSADETRRSLDGTRARALFEERYTRALSLRLFVRLVEDLDPGGSNREEGFHVTA